MSNFLPSILLWTFSQILPYLVSTLSIIEGHYTISSCNKTIMFRTFWFLICMVTIFPSIGLASFDIILEKTIKNLNATAVTDEALARFECIFLPSNGAFFVNYVITSAFIGTACELLRIPEFLIYMFRSCLASNYTEKLMLKKEKSLEFHYGLQYAWMLTIVATSITFSIVCPIITPFGLIYLLFKHYVDKYNLYYAYKPSNLDRECHKIAVQCILFSLYLLYFTVFFFTVLRTDSYKGWVNGVLNSPQAVFLFVVLLCYLIYKLLKKLKIQDEKVDEEMDPNFQSSKMDQNSKDSGRNLKNLSISDRNNFYLPKNIYLFSKKTAATEQAEYYKKLGLLPCSGGSTSVQENVT